MDYYFDKLPAHPRLEFLETLSSYRMRIAEANAIQELKILDRICFPSKQKWIQKIPDLPLISYGNLPQIVHIDISELQSSTVYFVAKLFGKSAHPTSISKFLAHCLNSTLRYCPACLKERPWYILPWRFKILIGCPIHQCRLCDHCPKCGNTISLLPSLLRVGRCPACEAELADDALIQLKTEEIDSVEQRYQDLLTVLRPLTWQVSEEARAKQIGLQYALNRKIQNIKVEQIASILGIRYTVICDLEMGNLQRNRLSLNLYFRYANILGISFFKIIDIASTSNFQDKDVFHHKWNDEELLIAMKKEKDIIIARGEKVSLRKILKSLKIASGTLWQYCESNRFAAEIARQDSRARAISLRDEEEAFLISQIEKAIRIIKESGQLITHKMVREILNITNYHLYKYPLAYTYISKKAEEYNVKMRADERFRKEEKLFSEVIQCIDDIKSEGGSLSKRAISIKMNKPLISLNNHPKIRLLLNELNYV